MKLEKKKGNKWIKPNLVVLSVKATLGGGGTTFIENGFIIHNSTI